MTLEAINVYAKVTGSERVTGDLDSAVIAIADTDPLALANGTGVNQADLQWSDTRTVGVAGETLDLNALVDSLGRTVNMAKVKVIIVKAAAANTGTIDMGNAAANQFKMGFGGAANTWTLPAGGIFMAAAPQAGWSSANGSFDSLKFLGSANGQVYSIWLIGTSV